MQCQIQAAFDGPEDPKQRALRGPQEGSLGLVKKALEPKPSNDTSPDEPRLGSCNAYPCPKSLPTMKILKIVRHVAHLGTGSQHERNNFQK